MATTSVRPPLTGTVTLLQEVPLKCSSTGELSRCKPSWNAVPAAHMSDGDDPEIEVMSRSGSVVGTGRLVVVQVVPLKCSASPLLLTDHRFVAENARTGPSSTLAGMVISDHAVPLKWNATDSATMVPPVLMSPVPTAVMLLAEVPVMKLTEAEFPGAVASPAGSPCPVQLVPFQCSNASLPPGNPTAQTSVGEAA